MVFKYRPTGKLVTPIELSNFVILMYYYLQLFLPNRSEPGYLAS